jgi:hypothetical protein
LLEETSLAIGQSLRNVDLEADVEVPAGAAPEARKSFAM